MASRYWRGGSGTWNSTNTTNWSTTSGGSGGASVPGSNDDVFFDAMSGGGTVTTSGEPYVRSITTTGFTGSISGALSAGSAAFGSSQTHSGLDLRVRASILYSILSNSNFSMGSGTSINYVRIYTYEGMNSNLQSAVNVSNLEVNNPTIMSSTFNTNAYSITAPILYIFASGATSGTFTVNLGSSSITCSSLFGYNHSSGSTNFSHSGTLNCGRFAITHNGGGSFSKSSGSINASGNNQESSLSGSGISISCPITISGTDPTFSLSTSGFSGSLTCTGNITCNGTYSGVVSLGGSSPRTITMNSGSLGTVTNSSSFPLSLTGSGTISSLSLSSFNNSLTLLSDFSINNLSVSGSSPGAMTIQGSGSVRTLTSTSFSLSNINWKNITAAGTIPFTGTGFTDGGGNTNIQFGVPGSSLFFGSNF